MKTYVFRVVVEPDDDGWVAYSPALKERGGATWGYTSEEALENIRQVLQMTVESLTNKESRFRRTRRAMYKYSQNLELPSPYDPD